MRRSPTKIVKHSVDTIEQKLRTRRGRNLVTYLICLVVAFLFWVMMTLDESTEREYRVPVELINVPDSVVVVGEMPSQLNVVVKGKGTQFIRYSLMSVPTLRIDFRQYATNDNFVRLTRSKLDVRLRELFGQGVGVVSVNPDSIRVGFTSGPGRKVALKVNSDISVSSHSVVSGPVVASVDSVMAYTVDGAPLPSQLFETEVVSLENISDTTVVKVGIRPVSGVRLIPDHVDVTVPVEMLVSKKSSLPIKFINVPENARLITYPSSIEVSYLVPMRLSDQPIAAEAVVDYSSINFASRFAAVNVSTLPGGYRIVSVSQDSVEYVVER